MTQEIQWGPAIAVDGKRPGWLGDGEAVQYHHSIEPAGKWCRACYAIWDDKDWRWVSAIRLPADHPHYRQTEEAPIDWSGELEAVHEDGRTIGVKVTREGSDGAHLVAASCSQPPKDWEDGYHKFDGTSFAPDDPWRIRNVPQPTPQADTKPDLTARMTLAEAEARGELCGCCTGREGYVQCLRDLGLILPEPVDPDMALAKEMFDAAYPNNAAWEVPAVYEGWLRAARFVRGRALALAGEKEA